MYHGLHYVFTEFMADCPANFCQNGGTCVVEVEQPQVLGCLCLEGYSGDNCMDGTQELLSVCPLNMIDIIRFVVVL